MKQIEVVILGQTYLLGCPEGGEAALLEAVTSVDREMGAIRSGGKVKARERIAVLAALNLAYALAGKPATPLSAADPNASTVATGEVDIDALIRRLDHALAADGQLL